MARPSPQAPTLRGAWIVRGGKRLAPVRSACPCESGSGLVRIRTTEAAEPVLNAGGGLLVIAERPRHGERYAAQALRCFRHHDGLELLASPLGEVAAEADAGGGEDEDYLVFGGRPPVPLRSLLVADSRCERGPRVRAELDAEAWERWWIPLRAGCACATGGGMDAACRWPFAPLVAEARLEVVRLRQRRTLRVSVDAAMTGRGGPTALMGHVIATERWAPGERTGAAGFPHATPPLLTETRCVVV